MKFVIGMACILVCVVAASAAPAKPAVQPVSAAAASEWETYPEPGPFIMSLARDGSGNVWVGTEGNGVWRFNPNVSSNQWTQFQAKKPEGGKTESGKQKSESGDKPELSVNLAPSSWPSPPVGEKEDASTHDGLGDDYVYSVAVDKQGRIWAGHLNHGVSVFNVSVTPSTTIQ